MQIRTDVPDTFTLSGEYEGRVLQALRLAQRQVRLAQGAARPHMQDALADLEDALGDQIAALVNAAEDDKAEAEWSGEAERERRAYYPARTA